MYNEALSACNQRVQRGLSTCNQRVQRGPLSILSITVIKCIHVELTVGTTCRHIASSNYTACDVTCLPFQHSSMSPIISLSALFVKSPFFMADIRRYLLNLRSLWQTFSVIALISVLCGTLPVLFVKSPLSMAYIQCYCLNLRSLCQTFSVIC